MRKTTEETFPSKKVRIKKFLQPYVWVPFLIQSTLWWLIAKPLFIIFCHLTVRGYEHVKNLQAPVIFAPNHSNPIDSVVLPLGLPFWSHFPPLFYVARKGKHYTGWRRFVFNFFNLEHIGAYAIHHDKKDYADALGKHVDILNDGNSMCIFPEGDTTKDGRIQHAHGGVSYLADATQSLIIPVLIEGTYHITPGKFFSRKVRVSIEFFAPVRPESVSYTNSAEVAQKYQNTAEKVLNVLRKSRGESEYQV